MILPQRLSMLSRARQASGMHPVVWKALTALLLLCVLVQQFSKDDSEEDIPRKPWQHYEEASIGFYSRPGDRTHYGHSDFDWHRDRNNHALSEEQCDIAFPDLYSEIDRAEQHWQGRNITPASIELYERNEAGVRVLIVDQQLRIVQTRCMFREDFRQRILAILHQLHRAVTSVEAIDDPFGDMEFTVIADDIPNFPDNEDLALWSFARWEADKQHENAWLIPDFNFWSSPPVAASFAEMQTKARKHDSMIAEKIQKVVWRGVQWTAPALRGALVDVSKDQPWADVKAMEWKDSNEVMALDELCDYGYVVNTEGRSWSSRLTHMLNCDSVPILHKMGWIAHYYHLLQPGTNYVPVHNDFTDLGEKVQHYIQHPAEAQEIANNARSTFRERYTTPAAAACYWRRLLRSWSNVAFIPETYEEVGSTDDKRIRGVSFEEFLYIDRSSCSAGVQR